MHLPFLSIRNAFALLTPSPAAAGSFIDAAAHWVREENILVQVRHALDRGQRKLKRPAYSIRPVLDPSSLPLPRFGVCCRCRPEQQNSRKRRICKCRDTIDVVAGSHTHTLPTEAGSSCCSRSAAMMVHLLSSCCTAGP